MKTDKLTIPQQIRAMKQEGIRFNIMNESEAANYLQNNTYYFRLKAYKKNYEFYRSGDSEGKYINLEFAYLVELSIIDMLFRNIVILMTLDIEHYCKNNLINDVTRDPFEDGVTILSEAFNMDEMQEELNRKVPMSACGDLIQAYSGKWAVWSLVEVLSFNQTKILYETFYRKHEEYDNIAEMLYSVKYLRNAAAHNNCLLNSLRHSYSSTDKIINETIFNQLSNSKFIPDKAERQRLEAAGEYVPTSKKLRNRMDNQLVCDFIVTIVAYNRIVTSNGLKIKRLGALKELFEGRMIKHSDYFEKNEVIKSTYLLVKKLIDFYVDNCI